ncbi:alpha/beta hydrolase [Psychromonas sp. KJ10-10]|uniref:alpha/beta hydrolase n=1 Tax=Psychromonas sp. KJ10-10 TaxID=3391823 RepID=UPI0039B3D0C5
MISYLPRIIFFSAIVLLTAYSQSSNDPNYQASKSLPDYSQDTFQQYIEDTKQWLLTHRVFKTEDIEKELQANLPFELMPEKANGDAVLLVHGLGDSPYSFIDVAKHLASKGYLVRTVLLPGHGSKVGDLMLPTLEDWQNVVRHHVALLKQQSNKLWLGGYSTGANLVTSEALNDPDIEGLLLFSPAFKPRRSIVKWANIASYVVTWADQDPETNYIRYNSLPMNGGAVYYQTTEVVQDDLKDTLYNKPIFMMLSEGDRVIDSKFPISVFEKQFINDNNQLIWQGEGELSLPNTTRFSMNRPDLHIVNGSHMGLLFAPNNSDYGKEGTIRICNNGQSKEQEKACEQGAETWFSSYGQIQEGKVLARLTYNPYFQESMEKLDKVMSN